MLQNLEETASEIIHCRARVVIEENRTSIKEQYTGFNPRLGKEAKLVVFTGNKAEDLKINPNTGGYNLDNARSFMEKPKNSIDLTKDTSNMEQKTSNTEFQMGIPETQVDSLPKQKLNLRNTQNTQQNTSSTVITKGNKKKKNKQKSKDKTKNKKDRKRKQSAQNDEPPKKKAKTSTEDELDDLFSAPGAPEKQQNLTNISPYHQDSRSNSRSKDNNAQTERRGSKLKRRQR